MSELLSDLKIEPKPSREQWPVHKCHIMSSPAHETLEGTLTKEHTIICSVQNVKH